MAEFNWPALTTTTAPVQYVKNGSPTQVGIDTTTPANTNPLPVRQVDSTGNAIDAATAAKQDTGNTSLASIDTKVTGVATSAKQDTGNASLATIATNTTGVATSAKQDTGNTSLASIDTKLSSQATGAKQDTGNGSLATIATNTTGVSTAAKQDTGNTSLATIVTNTTGIATSAKQDTGNTSLAAIATSVASIDTKHNSNYGAATGAIRVAAQVGSASGVADFGAGLTSAQTQRVVVASDQVVATKQGGKTQANAPIRNDYTATNVTTAAYVQLVASLTNACTEFEIFDSSGQTLTLAIGASGSEVPQINIFPGGNGRVPLAIAAGTRVAIKALSASATVGEIDINFYS